MEILGHVLRGIGIARRWCCPARLSAWLLLALILCAPLRAAPRGVDEYQLKAVFLFNFARFIDWPDSAFKSSDAPVVIGIVGSDPFGDRLDQAVTGERVRDHPIVVRRYKWHEDLSDCHIVFIASSEASRVQTVLSRLKGRSVLTVSDIANFAVNGGMIGFVTERGRVRLQINLGSTRSASLIVSSKLLRPSEVIESGSGQIFRMPAPGPCYAHKKTGPPARPRPLKPSSRST